MPRDTPRLLQAVLAGVAVGMLVAEALRPLRRRLREPRRRHLERNAAVAGIAAVTVQLLEHPVVRPLAGLVERRGWGLLPVARVPEPWRTLAALMALDYTLYLWHVLVHRVPALWRFHAVHHADLDMDASTATRFHFGELATSVPWRAAQVLLIGVTPRQLEMWQTLTLISVVFHHSNARLPRGLESALGYVVMTPRLHGLHHSRDEVEMSSNWSSGLTLWDRLHGTLRIDPRRDDIDVGVDGFNQPEDVTLARMLAAPFVPAPTAVVANRAIRPS